MSDCLRIPPTLRSFKRVLSTLLCVAVALVTIAIERLANHHQESWKKAVAYSEAYARGRESGLSEGAINTSNTVYWASTNAYLNGYVKGEKEGMAYGANETIKFVTEYLKAALKR